MAQLRCEFERQYLDLIHQKSVTNPPTATTTHTSSHPLSSLMIYSGQIRSTANAKHKRIPTLSATTRGRMVILSKKTRHPDTHIVQEATTPLHLVTPLVLLLCPPTPTPAPPTGLPDTPVVSVVNSPPTQNSAPSRQLVPPHVIEAVGPVPSSG